MFRQTMGDICEDDLKGFLDKEMKHDDECLEWRVIFHVVAHFEVS